MAALGRRFAQHMGWSQKPAPAAPPVPTLELDDSAIVDAARATQRRVKRRAAGGGAPRPTLLTGPSGLADVSMPRKTLLGS